MKISTSRKKIWLDWSFHIDGAGQDFDRQSISINFWPTAAAFTNDRLVVAGKTIKNKTKIVAYQFIYPNLPSDPEVQYAALVSSTQTLYNKREAGKIGVLHMWNNRGWSTPSGAVFVQFSDSRDIQLLDLASSTFSLSVPGSTHPLLASDRYMGVTPVDHLQEGLLYLFSPQPNGLPEDLLMLVDSNRDGVIDAHQSPSRSEWFALISDPSQVTLFD